MPMILYTTLVSQMLDVTVVVQGTTKRLQDNTNMIMRMIKLRLNRESMMPPEKELSGLMFSKHIWLTANKIW